MNLSPPDPAAGDRHARITRSTSPECARAHRQRAEIRDLLRGLGLAVSSGEVSALAARFLHHLEALHRRHAPQLAEALARQGGYPLHIDATGEDGRGTLFVAYAGWQSWVLGSWKLSTECADAILPHLQAVLRDFGLPRAIVRDLGRAVTEAARTVLVGLPSPPPVFCCQSHLVRDIGGDLLKADHNRLRDLFRHFAVRSKLSALVRDLGRRLGSRLTALRPDVDAWAAQEEPIPPGPLGLAVVRAMAQWAIDYADDGRHQGFPFDRPYLAFYSRCNQVWRASANLQRRAPADPPVSAALDRLRQALAPLQAHVAAGQIARRLQARATLLDQLRAALRLDAVPHLSEGRNSDSSPADVAVTLAQTEEAFDAFITSLRARRAAARRRPEDRAMLDVVLSHVDRHRPHLWGHVLRGPEPAAIHIVPRTNNILEQFFHRMKHGERRRCGRKVLTHDFETLLPAAALAYNLTRPDYVALVCGTLDALPACFSALDALPPSLPDPSAPVPSDIVTAALPLGDRRLVRRPALGQRLATAGSRR